MNRRVTSMLVGGVIAYAVYYVFRTGRMPRALHFTMNVDFGSLRSRLMRMMKRNIFMGMTFLKVMIKQLIRQLRAAR
ncbi:hypothetical protein SAMN04487866_108114 [Thermoactinomyces sp. DSM 45891]|uniref:hypothetical protein n=1 Tax=Thermoactinomyces sp. DSM 45891 TaxID=1761907 RepID=UPI00091F51B4|nr:hypothetical protein [Thermoactinomyces sp. DSM 45891]SFX46387.1 hypothetical protein SAMN04487866_108114 [Thermoactinomyces sp. DSM 45891]